ncbi:hypothetical protein AC1659_31245, partial [Rhodococcus erythropolis]|nr:hypothetical protein [Rhodococcus erythropolis]
ERILRGREVGEGGLCAAVVEMRGDGKVAGVGEAFEDALDVLVLSLDDIDLIEVNEAFAAQVLACAKAWGLSAQDIEERFNVNGS